MANNQTADMTAKAEKVAAAIATRFNRADTPADSKPSVRPGSHEALRTPDAHVVIWEDWTVPYHWPATWTDSAPAQELARELGVFLEPINGCTLGIYPDER